MRRPIYTLASFVRGISLPRLMALSGHYVLCPYYHIVSDKDVPYVKHLYRYRDVDTFCRDLDFLQQHFRPISWREIDSAEAEHTPSFCLTFDDGLREVYTTIAPILQERHIPAVFFLNSACVDNRHLFYRYKVSLIIEEGLRRGKSEEWKQQMLAMQYADTPQIDAIAQSLGINIEDYLKETQPYLTYPQIRELQEAGFEFGGHTVDHPHMYQLAAAEQKRQVETCMQELRCHIDMPDNLFAYPFGQEFLSEEELKSLQQGMDMVFGTANMESAPKPLYNRLWMEGVDYPAEDIIRGEYLRAIVKQRLHG